MPGDGTEVYAPDTDCIYARKTKILVHSLIFSFKQVKHQNSIEENFSRWLNEERIGE